MLKASQSLPDAARMRKTASRIAKTVNDADRLEHEVEYLGVGNTFCCTPSRWRCLCAPDDCYTGYTHFVFFTVTPVGFGPFFVLDIS